MEPEFENRFTADRAMIAEFYRRHIFVSRVPFGIFFWLLGLLDLIVMLTRGTLEGNWLGLVLYGCIGIACGVYPDFMAWGALRQSRKLNDGAVPETQITFGDTVELVEGITRLTIEYRKIVGVKRLKHSYVLMLGRRNGLLLDPNGFTKGTFGEFKEFLREKRPDLKIPE